MPLHLWKPPAPVPIRRIVERTALPLLLFSTVLTGLLLLSYFLLLPRFAEIEVGGERRNVSELKSYRSALLAEIATAEKERSALVLPTRPAIFKTLLAERRAVPSLVTVRNLVATEAAATVEQKDAVHLSAISIDAPGKSVELSGDVRFVGPSSMTVLAQFTDRLTHLSVFSSVAQPDYVREEDPVIGFHSPFRFTAQIR